MLIVSPVQTENEKDELCRLCGVAKVDGAFMYVANVDGKPVGISQFEISGEQCVVYNLANAEGKNDFEAMFIMGRQTLNFCDMCGSHDAFFAGRRQGGRASKNGNRFSAYKRRKMVYGPSRLLRGAL